MWIMMQNGESVLHISHNRYRTHSLQVSNLVIKKDDLLQCFKLPHRLRATFLLDRLGVNVRYVASRELYTAHKRELEKLGVVLKTP